MSGHSNTNRQATYIRPFTFTSKVYGNINTTSENNNLLTRIQDNGLNLTTQMKLYIRQLGCKNTRHSVQ